MSAQIELVEKGGLVATTVNPPEGEVCYLCILSIGTECIVTQIGDDIAGYGCATGIHFEDCVQMHSTLMSFAEFPKACCSACYT